MGGIDYLVLNHIINIDMGMWDGSSFNLTLLQAILDVNFKAYVHLASHALPALEASGGRIIVMSSLAGEWGNSWSFFFYQRDVFWFTTLVGRFSE